MRVLTVPASLLTVVVLAGGAVWAKDFRPITPAEKQLTQVPGHSNAPAVVLFHNADFRMVELDEEQQTSTLKVETRIKILTEEGKEYGELAVPHSRTVRLKDFEARTVLAGGGVVPVPEDSIFVRKVSESRKRFVTTAVFPAVEVGAILDLQYEIRIVANSVPPDWWFQREIPTLRSEIVYHVPKRLGVVAWSRDPMRTGIRQETSPTVLGHDIRVWGENLPPIPNEPHSLPDADLAARFKMIPTVFMSRSLGRIALYDSWSTTCYNYDTYVYRDARKRDSATRRRAREIVASLDGADTMARTQALYRFVRDEVLTEDLAGVNLREESTLDGVLAQKRGDYTEKALLLQAMLKAVKIDADLVWVASRSDGRIDLQVPDPLWFDKAIVRVEIDGEFQFLDPSARCLAFGRIEPDFEGTQALVFHTKKPETITLPTAPSAENLRQAKVNLVLDEEGRIAGTGSLVLGGHHAFEWMESRDGDEEPAQGWESWLDTRFPGYVFTDVEARESIADRQVRVTWSMTQLEEEVLGDEASLDPVRPLGPVRQPFTLPVAQRQTPVLFDFGDRDTVETSLRWPEGWEIDIRPESRVHEGVTGRMVSRLEVDEASRHLIYSRHLEINGAFFTSRDAVADLQTLFGETEKNDAQTLVLVYR